MKPLGFLLNIFSSSFNPLFPSAFNGGGSVNESVWALIERLAKEEVLAQAKWGTSLAQVLLIKYFT